MKYFSKRNEADDLNSLVGKAFFGHACEGPPGLAHGRVLVSRMETGKYLGWSGCLYLSLGYWRSGFHWIAHGGVQVAARQPCWMKPWAPRYICAVGVDVTRHQSKILLCLLVRAWSYACLCAFRGYLSLRAHSSLLLFVKRHHPRHVLTAAGLDQRHAGASCGAQCPIPHPAAAQH